jgi:hypothetical protein
LVVLAVTKPKLATTNLDWNGHQKISALRTDLLSYKWMGEHFKLLWDAGNQTEEPSLSSENQKTFFKWLLVLELPVSSLRMIQEKSPISISQPWRTEKQWDNGWSSGQALLLVVENYSSLVKKFKKMSFLVSVEHQQT